MGGKFCRWLRDFIGVGIGPCEPGGGCWLGDKVGALTRPPILGRNGIDLGASSGVG